MNPAVRTCTAQRRKTDRASFATRHRSKTRLAASGRGPFTPGIANAPGRPLGCGDVYL